jgi:hypothetical protein
MAKQVYPSDLPYPFSAAVRTGNLLFVSGQVGRRDGKVSGASRSRPASRWRTCATCWRRPAARWLRSRRHQFGSLAMLRVCSGQNRTV